MPDRVKIVAVGLLTEHDLSALGEHFRRAFPVEDLGGFDGLLKAIELADDEYQRQLQESYVSGQLKASADPTLTATIVPTPIEPGPNRRCE